MSAPVYLVDTNVILRFLTGDPPSHAAAARKLFGYAAAAEAILDISPVIVAEAFHTLHSFYKMDRKLIAENLTDLLQQPGVRLRDSDQTLGALKQLRSVNVGFADAFLAVAATRENVSIASFDRDFNKLAVPRFNPLA